MLITTAFSAISDVEMRKEEDRMQTCYTLAVLLGGNGKCPLVACAQEQPGVCSTPPAVKRV